MLRKREVPPLLPFWRKPESLWRSRIRRRRTLQCSASRKILAVARIRFRLSPPPPFHSREGGNLPVCWGEQRSHRIVFLQLEGREIPAFAGMGVGEIKEKAAANSTHPSIPAKAGILRRSRIRRKRPLQCSALRKILAVARMRFRLSPEWKDWLRRADTSWLGNKFPRKFRAAINYGARRNIHSGRNVVLSANDFVFSGGGAGD